MDAFFIAVAFFFGLIAQQFRLPPLVGFIVAGFVLQAFGQEGGATLGTLADLGVTLMLFGIGIKLQVRSLMRPEIWLGTSIHTTAVVLSFTPVILILGTLLGSSIDFTAALLIAFALSFSSTVFAVKSLEENGDTGSLHGKVAIGILIMQDIFAVVFLTASTGKLPSIWAPVLILVLLAGRGILKMMIERSGHGELITLCGLSLALFIGAEGFESVGLKADLGALFLGVLIGGHPKAKELSKSLGSFTNVFLVGFFLQIGLNGALTLSGVAWAIVLSLLIPFKAAGFFFLLTRFHLRARTGWLAGLTLATYSEFGLIVAAVGAGLGWISPDWVVIIALALSLSFLIAAPLVRRAEILYDPRSEKLKKFETTGTHPDDLPVEIEEERIAIFGMGRVGQAVYRDLEARYPGKVIGFDRDAEAVTHHRANERNVRMADATDSDFWDRISARNSFDLVVLAMPVHASNRVAAETLKRHAFEGVVVGCGKFDDEVRELREIGVDTAYNLYSQAGAGFARHTNTVLKQQRPDLAASWIPSEDPGPEI